MCVGACVCARVCARARASEEEILSLISGAGVLGACKGLDVGARDRA